MVAVVAVAYWTGINAADCSIFTPSGDSTLMDERFATGFGLAAIMRYATSEIAPVTSDVPSVIDATAWTPSSPAANWNGIKVPATAVAGKLAIVAVRPAFPWLSVYDAVIVVTAAAFVVAVVTRIASPTPSPLTVDAMSLAGNATEVTVYAVVVVTERPVLTHKKSITIT